MKKWKLFDKLAYRINIFLAFLLVLSYLGAYIKPQLFPLLPIFALFGPVFMIANFFCAFYWGLKINKKAFLSLVVLGMGWPYLKSMYLVNFDQENKNKGISILSYNVRLFNKYQWIKDEKIGDKISHFLYKEDVDILCLQEFHKEKLSKFVQYPYQYIEYRSKDNRVGQAIFSKFPILQKGSLDFKNTANNAIYADIKLDKDTLRVYNLHLESFRIRVKQEVLQKEGRDKNLFQRVQYAFLQQEKQIKIFLDHFKKSTYKSVVATDLNNTGFSYIYNRIKHYLKDAFIEKGRGIGRTLNYKYFPLRIDFLFVSKSLSVTDFKTYTEVYSDHFPIKTVIDY